MERNYPHVVKADASNPVTRRGAFAVSNCLAGYGESTPYETAARFGAIEAAHAFVNAVNESQEQIIVAAMSYGTDLAPAASACIAACECSMNVQDSIAKAPHTTPRDLLSRHSPNIHQKMRNNNPDSSKLTYSS